MPGSRRRGGQTAHGGTRYPARPRAHLQYCAARIGARAGWRCSALLLPAKPCLAGRAAAAGCPGAARPGVGGQRRRARPGLFRPPLRPRDPAPWAQTGRQRPDAAWRRPPAARQHPDRASHRQAAGVSAPDRWRRLEEGVAGLAELGVTDLGKISSAIGAAFAAGFGVGLAEVPLRPEEEEAARALARAKYQSARWTER